MEATEPDADGDADNTSAEEAVKPAAAPLPNLADPSNTLPPGTDLGARLAKAAADVAAAAAELQAAEPVARPGRLRRGAAWLFAPASRAGANEDDPDVPVEDEPEVEALEQSPIKPVRPWLRKRVSPIEDTEPEPTAEPEPEPEPESEPEEDPPAVEEEPSEDDTIRPGADLVRRLAEANANALSNTRMGTPAEMPEIVEPPGRFARWRGRNEPDEQPVPITQPPEPVQPEPASQRSTDTAEPETKTAAAARPWLRLLVVIAIAAAAAIGLRAYVVAPYYIPSQSMEQTLHGCPGCNNDHVLVNKLSYRFHDPRRGDIVVFRRPSNWHVTEKLLIKRVIGLPGDTLTAKSGVVYINGLAVQEPYVNKVCGGTNTPPLNPITVPKGQVFVMGDNRCNSEDSRVFGPIKISQIVGRAFVIVWPLGRIHWL